MSLAVLRDAQNAWDRAQSYQSEQRVRLHLLRKKEAEVDRLLLEVSNKRSALLVVKTDCYPTDCSKKVARLHRRAHPRASKGKRQQPSDPIVSST